MNLREKIGYLKGLMDGVKIDKESDEGKVLCAMMDLLVDVTRRVVDIEETTIAISDELDAIEEDLDAIEDYILDEEDDDFDYDYDDDDEDEFDEEGFDFGDEDTIIYEAKCGKCGAVVCFDEDTLEEGSIVCECGEVLEFSFDDDDFEDEEESEEE